MKDLIPWAVRLIIVSGFTMGGYIGKSVLDNQKSFSVQLENFHSDVRVIANTMKLRSEARDEQIGVIKGQIADHEGRIRGLEAKR